MATLDEIDLGLAALGNALSVVGGQGNGISANPLVFSGATASLGIGRLARLTTISAATAILNCATLPINPVLNAEQTVCNVGGFPIYIYPSPGTTNNTTATVAGGQPGQAYLIPPGGSATFTCVANTSAAMTALATTGGTWIVKQCTMGCINTLLVATAATTVLAPALVGTARCLILVPAMAAALAITLPANSYGAEYIVQLIGVPGHVITTAGGAGNISGVVSMGLDNTVIAVGGQANGLMSATAAANDSMRFVSGGIGWSAYTIAAVHTTATFT